MSVKLGNINLSEHKGTFIVFEAGPTHTGLESAKKLAEISKKTGADAIKFQYINAERLIADKKIEFSYKVLEVKDGKEMYIEVKERLYNILKRRELKKSEWKELKAHCDKLGIPMFCTAMYEDEVDFLVDELGIESIKIASADINHLDFIGYCARKGINIQIDTGNADLWEIEKAVIEIEQSGNNNIIIHLCPTGYPAYIESINLKMIKTLRIMFPNYQIAFSDHSPGYHMDVAAVALGAKLVEKTITLDRTQKSCEHSFSLTPEDAKRFVEVMREIDTALGSSRRVIPPEEKIRRKLARRSPYAKRYINAGEKVVPCDFEFKRPEKGLNGYEFRAFIGKKLRRPIKVGEVLTINHFVEE